MVMRMSKELQTGKAGEYLVCADMILKGAVAYPSEQGLPYDVVIDISGKLFKCQVKTTSGVRKIPQRNTDSYAYIFNIKRHGKNGQQRYLVEEVDLFALVALDVMRVGYVVTEGMPDTINVRSDELRGDYYDEKGIADFEKVRWLRNTGMKQAEIARTAGLSPTIVSRMCADGYQPHKSNARYFSDFHRELEWFQKL